MPPPPSPTSSPPSSSSNLPLASPLSSPMCTPHSCHTLSKQVPQTAWWLKIVYAMLGFIHSPIAMIVIQVLNIQLAHTYLGYYWAVQCHKFPPNKLIFICSTWLQHTNLLYMSMVLAWSLTKVMHYVFYTFSLVSTPPHFLLWLHYTTFYILYSIGVGSEVVFLSYLLYCGDMPHGTQYMWSSGV